MSSQSFTVALSMQSRQHAEVRGVSFSDGGDITSGGWEEWLEATTKGNKSTSASGNQNFHMIFCVLLSDVSTSDTSVYLLLPIFFFNIYNIIFAVKHLRRSTAGLSMSEPFLVLSALPGVQRQIVHCVERTTGIVEEHWCDPLSRPDDNQTSCQKDPCPAVWVFPGCQHLHHCAVSAAQHSVMLWSQFGSIFDLLFNSQERKQRNSPAVADFDVRDESVMQPLIYADVLFVLCHVFGEQN